MMIESRFLCAVSANTKRHKKWISNARQMVAATSGHDAAVRAPVYCLRTHLGKSVLARARALARWGNYMHYANLYKQIPSQNDHDAAQHE